jgi:hypothetical protein
MTVPNLASRAPARVCPPVCCGGRRRRELFANREQQPDGERCHLHVVQQLRHAERKPRLAGEPVDTDETERQPDEQAGEPRTGELPKVADTVMKATHISAK